MKISALLISLLNCVLVTQAVKPKPPAITIQDVANGLVSTLEDSVFARAFQLYDPVLLNATTDVTLELSGNCGTTQVIYNIEHLTGLRVFMVDSVRAVGRSDTVSVDNNLISFDGFFQVEISFPQVLDADFTVQAMSDTCGVMEANTDLQTDATSTVILAIRGSGQSTDSLEINYLRFFEMDMYFQNLATNVLLDNIQLDATDDILDLLDGSFNNYTVPELIGTVEGWFGGKPKA